MAMITDTRTGFPIADPDLNPFSSGYTPRNNRLDFSSYILSASGWRKVFAADGNEESCVSSISPDDKECLVLVGNVLSAFFRAKTPFRAPCIAVGIDTRYTGPAIADILIRTMLVHSLDTRYLFIASAPEIMAYTKVTDGIDGFVYISASHNPVGHNGLKFGLSDGAVLGGSDSETLIKSLLSGAESASGVRETIEAIAGLPSDALRSVYQTVGSVKAEACTAYDAFTREVITGIRSQEKQAATLSFLKKSIEEHSAGIVCDMNGSARTVTIDREFLDSFGIPFRTINALPRQIAHRIVPEGESLVPCARFLEQQHAADHSFVFGYVPDNDGDRGNLVYSDRDGTSKLLEAQEVFALVCVAELAWLAWTGTVHYDEAGKARERIAVVVNGPTSLRVERIAQAFDARVFRAEVGEANVVSLAANLRKNGYIVRILGEGSNGGNITHPSTVRDPLDTVFSILKLLSVRSVPGQKGLFDLWCEFSGQAVNRGQDFSLPDILDTLPRFTTTSAFENRAKLTIRTRDHGLLKARYEVIFMKEWDERKAFLKDRFGFWFQEEVIYEGTTETHGSELVTRAGRKKGGYKVLFKDRDGKQIAFIWMRGSGTEPVFRLMADIEGDNPEAEAYLLEWHRSMILKADSAE